MSSSEIVNWYKPDFDKAEEREGKFFEMNSDLDVEGIILDHLEKGEYSKAITLFENYDLENEEEVYEKIAQDCKESIKNANSLEDLYNSAMEGVGLISHLGGNPEEYGLKERFEEEKPYVLIDQLMEERETLDNLSESDAENYIEFRADDVETMMDLLEEDSSLPECMKTIKTEIENLKEENTL